MAEIQHVSVRHEAIMDFLLAHPSVRLADVANHFNMTQPWLSQVIHSDAFQARLKEKQDIAFHHTVLPIREKMTALAHISLDKLMDQVPLQTDMTVVNKVAENVLDRLGFGTKTAPSGVNVTAQNVQLNVLRSELEEAREVMLRVNGASDGSPKQIPHQSVPELGTLGREVAIPVPAESLERGSEERAQV